MPEQFRENEAVHDGSPRVTRGRAQWLGYGIFFVLLASCAYLFYLGGYRRLLVDESASFAVELTMRIIDANRDARLLVVGNSTVAEGFRASTYNDLAPEARALNLGIGSAHFYLYEKIVALSLQRGMQPRAVLLMLTPESLSLRPGYDTLLNDLTLLKTELGVEDYARLWRHSPSFPAFMESSSRLALRPALYSADLKDLLTHMVPRVRKIIVTQNWLKTAGEQPEALETDHAFAVCDAGPLRELQQTIAAERALLSNKQSVSTRLADLEGVWAGYAPRVHQPLAVNGFETERLVRLLEFLAARVPRVYVVQAPYFDPDFDAYTSEYRAALAQTLMAVIAQSPGVTLLPEFPADCSMFFDTVHLNHTGGDQFTTYLYEQMEGPVAVPQH